MKAKAIEHDIKVNGKLDVHKYFPKVRAEHSGDEQTLSEFFEFYTQEKTIRPSSWENLMMAWNRHIKPFFGEHLLKNISKHDVLVFRNYLLTEKKLAPSTVNLMMVHLAGMLTRAHQEGFIPTYPMLKIGKLAYEKNRILPFSFEELEILLAYVKAHKPEYYDMLFLWSRLGFRYGEILVVKWADLDYYSATLDIRATMTKQSTEGPPKTKQSARTLTLTEECLEAFRRQEKRSRLLGEYIFTDPVTGKRYATENVFASRFMIWQRVAGLKQRSPNQMRHTFATLHIAAGESITWVSKMLGHRNVTTTMEHYNKYIPNLTQNDGSAFENALKKRQNGQDMGRVNTK